MPMKFQIFYVLTLISVFRISYQVCPKGLFGAHCLLRCRCKGGDTNCNQGNCTQGCDFQFIGPSCQYKAFPPVERLDQLWLVDGNPYTCNNGIRPIQTSPTFRTAVMYIRVTFREPGAAHNISIRLFNQVMSARRTMTCSTRLIHQADTAGTVYDFPCFTKYFVDFITIDGVGVFKICDLLISPGRNIAAFQTAYRIKLPSRIYVQDAIAKYAVDGYTYQDRPNYQVCSVLDSPHWGLRMFMQSVNLITIYNTGDASAQGVGMFEFSQELPSGRNVTLFNKTDPSYEAFFVIVQPKKEDVISRFRFKKTDGVRNYHLCEVETLGELNCCHVSYGHVCLNFTVQSPNPLCSHIEHRHGICPLGFTGNFCDEECPEEYYGLDCSSHCADSCKERKCDFRNGKCVNCHPGYTGFLCDQACTNYYGAGCSKQCSFFCDATNSTKPVCDHRTGACLQGCKSNRVGERCQWDHCSNHCFGGKTLCDRYLGTCLLGCEPGYTTPFCNKECVPGTYGKGCKKNCSPNCDPKGCDGMTGQCIHGCKAGFQGAPTCNQKCYRGSYGKGCKLKCSSHCKRRTCYAGNGVCNLGCNLGYEPPLCNNVCRQNYFGKDCHQRCSSSCKGGTCNPSNGTCKTCEPGAQGPRCRKACPPGKFGAGCLKSCAKNCPGQNRCDPVTGLCQSCPAGKMGQNCTQNCDLGRFGVGCIQFCSEFCFQGSCDPVNGSCINGCVRSFVPPTCKTCQSGWYSRLCDEQCSQFCEQSECDPGTGKCYYCVEGRYGDFCEKRIAIPRENILIAGLLLVILMSTILGVAICMNLAIKQARLEEHSIPQEEHTEPKELEDAEKKSKSTSFGEENVSGEKEQPRISILSISSIDESLVDQAEYAPEIRSSSLKLDQN